MNFSWTSYLWEKINVSSLGGSNYIVENRNLSLKVKLIMPTYCYLDQERLESTTSALSCMFEYAKRKKRIWTIQKEFHLAIHRWSEGFWRIFPRFGAAKMSLKMWPLTDDYFHFKHSFLLSSQFMCQKRKSNFHYILNWSFLFLAVFFSGSTRSWTVMAASYSWVHLGRTCSNGNKTI